MSNVAYVGYEKITALGSVAQLTVPQDVGSPNMVLIEVEAQDVRYRADGIDPTAATGGLMKAGAQYEYTGNLQSLKFIEVSAGAILNVNYYKRINLT